jgi:gamma-glutamyltranspeptidase/glutathione hydrolase
MTIQEAIDTPRIFDNAGNKINYESGENGLKPETVKALEDMGHEMVERGEWDLYFGGVQGIVYREDGTLHGGADPRRDGKAVGF